ncbi:MAG: ATP-binding protein [Muribaculaceae bacterium]|nr:ATP-binding protein [Muribaculaceae bacterium]MDE6196277.1 ATP-binding protein [Muribaculaceae bacterium]
MKDLKAIRGTVLLRKMVAEGEHERQDFKFAISDARKIARSLSAFANNSGGRLLIGVKDNGVIAGVRNEEDIYMVELAADRYCRPSQHVDFAAYRLEDGVRVIVASIGPADSRPVMVDEGAGNMRAYYRVADENIAAHPLMERAWRMSASGELPPLTERHYALAALFDTPGKRMDERQIALALHVPVDVAEDMVARLLSAGVLAGAFDGTRFLFTLSD